MKWIQRKAKVKPSSVDTPKETIAKIRGIDDVERFLNPSQDELHDPYLIKNIEDASNRIIKAIMGKERILLSYDADADGLTSTSMMYRYLSNYTEHVDYIYNERNHGHGIHEQTRLDFLSPEDTDENDEIINPEKAERMALNLSNLDKIEQSDLLIIIDSSSNDTKACKKLIDAYGVEIIILDHHAIERENPHALIVNPQQDGDEYPNKFLSGAGVVFKTIQVMEDTLGQVDPWQYNDLLAVGMYADVMRIDVPENRYLIMNGLRNINNAGLTRILKGAKADFYKLNGDTIGFSIAPLLNGVARMDKIKLAIDILLEDDDNVCKKLRLQMQKINDTRKVLQKQIVEQYMTKVDSSKKVLMVFDEQSSKGFNGIVAQNLSETYKRPVLVGRLHNGVASGSFRSYNGFKMKSFLQEFGDIEAMGHEGAGGFSVKEEKLEELDIYIKRLMPSLDEKEPTVVYDLEINVDELGEYIGVVEQFNKLTGNGFPKIVTRVNGITVEEAECIGKTRETVKIKTYDDMELIKFRVDENYASELGHFDEVNVVGELRMNEFYHFGLKQKIITPQVMISDYQVN
jgi:single-stranded-DNA-specific exonuclease